MNLLFLHYRAVDFHGFMLRDERLDSIAWRCLSDFYISLVYLNAVFGDNLVIDVWNVRLNETMRTVIMNSLFVICEGTNSCICRKFWSDNCRSSFLLWLWLRQSRWRCTLIYLWHAHVRCGVDQDRCCRRRRGGENLPYRRVSQADPLTTGRLYHSRLIQQVQVGLQV